MEFCSSFFSPEEKKLLNEGKIGNLYLIFRQEKNIFGCAYCMFLQKKLDEAFSLLIQIKDSSPVVNWLLCLIGVITGDKQQSPSFFQIRNFFEIDMNMLFEYQNTDFIEKIFSELSYFEKYNREIYKYAARVLMDNERVEDSIIWLKKSIDICYNDPESHFMLADVYLSLGYIDKARAEYYKSNETGRGYFPAIKKLELLK